jgi:cytochrome c
MKYMLVLLIGFGLYQASAHANDDLARTKNCMACHAVERKLVGPSYADISAKYKSRNDNVAYLAGKIRNGSQGAWGPIPMPAQRQVSEAEAEALAKWILTK